LVHSYSSPEDLSIILKGRQRYKQAIRCLHGLIARRPRMKFDEGIMDTQAGRQEKSGAEEAHARLARAQGP
jgi:hypothetical protein